MVEPFSGWWLLEPVGTYHRWTGCRAAAVSPSARPGHSIGRHLSASEPEACAQLVSYTGAHRRDDQIVSAGGGGLSILRHPFPVLFVVCVFMY